MKFGRDELDMGHEKTVNFSSYKREIFAFDLFSNIVRIGGPAMIVAVNETVYTRRKYNRGRQLHEQWVFGGICRETKDYFLYAVPS